MASAEAKKLSAWRRANPSAQRDDHVVAYILERAPSMEEVWSSLRPHGDVVMPVFVDSLAAFRAAHREVMREPAKEESAKIRAVSRLARQLRDAIEVSPLPKNRGRPCELRGTDMPPVPFVLGWRDLREDGYGFGYSIAIADLLEDVAKLAEQHLESLPVRAVSRNRGDPWLPAFVRHLTFLLLQRFGKRQDKAVAGITTAILAIAPPPDPVVATRSREVQKERPIEMGVRDIQAMLKDAPEPFLQLLKRQKQPR